MRLKSPVFIFLKDMLGLFIDIMYYDTHTNSTTINLWDPTKTGSLYNWLDCHLFKWELEFQLSHSFNTNVRNKAEDRPRFARTM